MNRSDIPTASEPIHQPKIRIGRVVTGIALCIAGLILLPTVAMTAAGVALCFVGVFLIVMAFANRKYGGVHTRKGSH